MGGGGGFGGNKKNKRGRGKRREERERRMLKQQQTRRALWEPAWKSKHGIKRQEVSHWPQKTSEQGRVGEQGEGVRRGDGRGKEGWRRIRARPVASKYASVLLAEQVFALRLMGEKRGGAVEAMVLLRNFLLHCPRDH